jgi:acetyl esterase/lipase
MMLRSAIFVCVSLGLTDWAAADEPPVVLLWEKGAPGFESRKDEKEVRDRLSKETGEFRTTNIHNPYVTVFLPKKGASMGTAVVIVPGGGHRELWVKHEGENIAAWLSQRGIAAVVLRYRLGRERGSPYKIDVHALEDGQRAIRLVRSRADEWGVDPQRIGMMGFSAGGEVVGMVCRAMGKGDPNAADPIDKQSAMPNFHALIYSGPLGVAKQTITRENTPPAFLLVGDDDAAANVLTAYYQDLRKAKVSAEFHVYAKAGHGFGFRPSHTTGKAYEGWPFRFLEFLGTEGMLKKP